MEHWNYSLQGKFKVLIGGSSVLRIPTVYMVGHLSLVRIKGYEVEDFGKHWNKGTIRRS